MVLQEQPMVRSRRPPPAAGIGQRVRDLRLDRGVTQVELAKLIDVTQPMLSAYETGRRSMPHDMLAKIARALDASVDDLTAAADEWPETLEEIEEQLDEGFATLKSAIIKLIEARNERSQEQ